MQVTFDQFIEENCHLNNAVQRCYLLMRDCDVKAESLRQQINGMKHKMQLAISAKEEKPALEKLYWEQLAKHEELDTLGQRKMVLAAKAYDFQLMFTSLVEKKLLLMEQDEDIQEEVRTKAVKE